ncbi:MAG: tetratricopeptide repeat protein [Anaerolineales bacterium]|nr:tetratricopeptide repeat protein [Anaerolineales bacterium]
MLVIQSVYQSLVFDLQSDAQVDELLKSMYNVLAAEKNPIEENKILKDEIGYWLEGRSLTKKFDYPSAKSQLMNAVRENPNNPALYYEMARIYIQMGKTSEYNYALALDQLESMLQIDSSRGDFAKF